MSSGGDGASRHPRSLDLATPRLLSSRDVLLIAFLALVAFLPGVFGQFVNWDDDRNFLFNPAYRGLGWIQLRWMFTTSHMGPYAPLTWLTLGADYLAWGMRPLGYHLTSLGFHVGAAVVWAFVAGRLLRAALPTGTPDAALRIGAVGAALAFAVHPLRVESVVWLTERRDVVSGLFYLLAVLAYLRWVDTAPRRLWYGLSLGFFVIALFSKSIVVTLPAVLLILDVYPLRRLGGGAGWTGPTARRVYAEKIPFFCLSAVGSAVAFMALAHVENMPSWKDFGAGERAAVSAYGLAFYLWKTVWPLGLSPLYELPPRLEPLSAPFVISAAMVLAATAVAVAVRRRWPALTAAWCAYAVSVLPVLGIFQNGPQIAADRYTYLSCLSWAVLAGGALAWTAARWLSRPGPIHAGGLAAATLIGIVLVALTARQCLVWQDSIALWSHVVATDPAGARGHTGLAVTVARLGHAQEAHHHLERALALDPGLPEALIGMGATLAMLGRPDEALPYAKAAVKRKPRDSGLHGVLGEVQRRRGDLPAAAAAFREATRLNPDVPLNHYDLARTLSAMGNMPEAEAALERGRRASRRLQANDPEAVRAEALVYTPSNPARAIAAWERYLAAVGQAPEPSVVDLRRMAEGLAALDQLRAGTGPASSR